jgi:hypothetical protein
VSCALSAIGTVGVLAPLTVLGAGAGEAEDGALTRAGPFAGLPGVFLFTPGVIIGGRETEVLFERFWLCPVNDGRITVGPGLSAPADFALPCGSL